jgi:hypothetical protein
MPKFENLYLISPDLVFSQIEKDLGDLNSRQNKLESALADIRSVATMLLTDKMVEETVKSSTHLKQWFYDARFPNYTQDNLYEIEKDGLIAKRWVGPERALEFSLLLDRTTQYELTIRVSDFVSDFVEQGFNLTVDGTELPWLSVDERVYMAIIPEDVRPRIDPRTPIAIGASRSILPVFAENDKRTLWFSVNNLKIMQL